LAPGTRRGKENDGCEESQGTKTNLSGFRVIHPGSNPPWVGFFASLFSRTVAYFLADVNPFYISFGYIASRRENL
jgi:hypothetical protein